jgi:hypothetical protein
MHGPLQYGTGVKAFIIQLIVIQMVSLRRAACLVRQLLGQAMSEATMLKFIINLSTALASWEDHAKAILIKAITINTDETSLRVDKKRQWIHVYSTGELTLKLLHAKRGKDAIEEFQIIPKYGGIIIHDCWASYLSYDHLQHGLCGSHLLRELQFVIDSNKYHWARNMKRLLRLACRMVTINKNKCLEQPTYLKLESLYKKILLAGQKEMPIIPDKTSGKHGKVAKSDAHNLCERMSQHTNAVLLFAKNKDVPFTNNRAERDLRMAKVKQKVSGCFRTKKYAEAYCRISSYLQTMSNKGINHLVAIGMALKEEQIGD